MKNIWNKMSVIPPNNSNIIIRTDETTYLSVYINGVVFWGKGGYHFETKWSSFSNALEWCLLDDLVNQNIEMHNKNNIIESLVDALNFYASGKHIKKYIPDYLKHAMMSNNSSRYEEMVVDRGTVAKNALLAVRDYIDNKTTDNE